MGYFAKISSNGNVEMVISVANSVLGEPENFFPQTETIGKFYITNFLGILGDWKQTSYNGSFRKNYAGIGYLWDSSRDAFIAPQPFPSWVLDEETCRWTPPVPRPDGQYEWDEDTTSWKEIANDPV